MEKENKRPTVFTACRRGKDPATAGQTCDCMVAYNLSEPGNHVVKFECQKCHYTWTTAIGGGINI